MFLRAAGDIFGRHSRDIWQQGVAASDTLSQMPTALRAFLADPRRPSGTLAYHELQGFLFAVACAPELAKPSEWLPIVFGEKDAGYETLEQAREVLGELMTLYNSVNAAVVDRATLPSDCEFRVDLLANFEADAPVAQWSRGFLRGHQWLEESWEYVPKKLDDEFAAMLMTLSFFSSRQLAEAFSAETEHRNLERLATTMRRVFPNAVAEYAHLGRTIHQVLMEEANAGASKPVVKVGRNEPCPCGSGRKFKKCCGAASAN